MRINAKQFTKTVKYGKKKVISDQKMKSHVDSVQVSIPLTRRQRHRSGCHVSLLHERHVTDRKSVYDPTSLSTVVVPLLNYQLKSHAFDILKDSIRSVGDIAISNCVYSTGGKSGHQTWGLCTKSTSVSNLISTLVFRKFRKLGFVELTYVATATNFRRDGFGSYFLSSMLDIWRDECIAYVFTFADFGAIKFFESQGFVRDIPVPRDLYDCWIDKYSHSVLMCCTLKHSFISHNPVSKGIEILIYIENAVKHAKEIWVPALVIYEDHEYIKVHYSAWLRRFTEVLPCESLRLRYNHEE